MLKSEPTKTNERNENEHTDAQRLIKIPTKVNNGRPRSDGTRYTVGKIYLPADWIGKAVICSTTWNENETIPENHKTRPVIIRSEWTPGQIITAINKTVGKHHAGGRISGCLFVPSEWIDKKVLIRPADQTETRPAGCTAPQEVE